MKKTLVIDVVGLTNRLIGENTPFLSEWTSKGKGATIQPVIPAVTCSAQSTYVTGKMPEEHGIVGNGWYFKAECEIKFWRQSNKLVQSPKIWEIAKSIDPSFTCAKLFWWYNMYSNADYAVTPRPMYPVDGRKIPDVYSHPMDLRDRLNDSLGMFPLFEFWGPRTSIRSSQWIADCTKKVEEWHNPTLSMVYLPHMDYNIQRHGNNHPSVAKDLQEIDAVLKDLITFFEDRDANVILLSEYGITDVQHPVHLNRVLREAGFITIKKELGLELLDAGASKAFAVADHQVAHIYVQNEADIPKVKKLIANTEGVEKVLDYEGKKIHQINHNRSGNLVAIANSKSWFTYYYWMDDKVAPDFARTVDIHRKPGYDPVEMFINPKIPFPIPLVAWKLLKRKLGFRVLMDIIPLDASLVKGSHGRIPEEKEDFPVFITNQPELLSTQHIKPTDVFELMLNHLQY